MSADAKTTALLIRCQSWFQRRADDDNDLEFHNSDECRDEEDRLLGDLAVELTRLGAQP